MEDLLSNPAALLVSGGVVTLLVASWNHVKSFLGYIKSYVVISADMTRGSTEAVLSYARANWTESRYGLRAYCAMLFYVRPRRRREWVAMETIGKETRLFWKGWLPLWVSRTSSTRGDVSDEYVYYQPVKLTFFRGTIQLDRVVSEAVEHYNQMTHSASRCRRYQVSHVYGSGKKPASVNISGGKESGGGYSPVPDADDDDLAMLHGNRLLRWEFDQVGPDVTDSGTALDRLWLNEESREIVRQVREWLQTQDWHRERGVPWKRGYGLFGPPGTGKTALVRAIGEDFDLPVYVFDLATLHNDEMRRGWQRMLSRTPCIGLIEDIDAVFDKRTPLQGHLTFDCLLNCLDGVERSDGLLTFVTTNRPETLDEALGGGSLDGTSTRPGRIDYLVATEPLSREGREYLAKRILADLPDGEREAAVAAGDGDTGAQFERRCVLAIGQRKWAAGAYAGSNGQP